MVSDDELTLLFLQKVSIRRTLRSGRTAEINMAPFIDLVFLLLIFFLVTMSFVKESGVDVERPQASTATLKEAGNILIGVSAAGAEIGRAS